MSRNNELECLNKIKDAFAGRRSVHIWPPFRLDQIKEYLFRACPNPNNNVFPDFIFEGGCVEHFELTSSKETRKGSEFKIEENINNKKKKSLFTEFQNNDLSSKHIPFSMTTTTCQDVYEWFSYEECLMSLEKTLAKHIESLSRSDFVGKNVVFLLEQQTARMVLDDGAYPIHFYELHKDKKALEIIKNHCKNLTFLVYFVADSIEIIDLNNIDNMLNRSSYQKVKGGRLTKEEAMLIIHL